MRAVVRTGFERGVLIMAAPFTTVQSSRFAQVQRWLHRATPEDALVDINNLLAAADIRSLDAAAVDRILRAHRVTEPAHRRQLERFYREYLVFCLQDHRLSETELDDLEHLRCVLDLDAETVDSIHRNVARQIYFRSVDEVLGDGTIDERERAFLSRLREQLSIPEAIADNIVEMRERQYRSRHRSTDRHRH